MAVYVDRLAPCSPTADWPWDKSAHMAADSIEELHAFALSIGLKRHWFQNHRRLPHYDLTEKRRKVAVRRGAVEITRAQVVALMRGEKISPRTPVELALFAEASVGQT